MKIQIIQNINKLEEYRVQWQEILKTRDNDITFIEIDWIVAWWKYFGEQHELFILKVEEKGQILGFCPFMKNRRRIYEEITSVGNPQASYIDFVIKEEYKEKVIPFVMDFLLKLRGRYLFNFYGFLENSKSNHIIHNYLVANNIPFFYYSLAHYYKRMAGKFESYFDEQFSSKTKGTMRRKERRLNNLGKLSYDRLGFEHVDRAFRIHDKRWQRKIGDSQFSQGNTEKFFKELTLKDNYSFHTTIDGVTLEDKVLAFIYGFECGGRYIFYRIAHDDDFYIFSPGEVVLRKKIEECFKKGIKIFDFGAGYEPYKADWTESYIGINTFVFPNHSLLSKLIFRKQRIIKRIKTFLKRSKAIVNFRKYILGKMKYRVSKEYRSQLYKQWRGILRRQGTHSLIRSIISPIIKYDQYFIMHKILANRSSNLLVESSYRMRELTIKDVDTILDITGEKISNIIRKLSMKHKFYTIKKKDKVVFYYWLGFENIHIKQIKEQKSIKKKEGMIYDATFLTKEDTKGIFEKMIESLKEDLIKKGYRKLYIGCLGRQKDILREAKGKGFQLGEKITLKGFLGKTHMSVEKYKGKEK